MERLSPNSVQTLEIKIRLALLKNDDIEAENKLLKLAIFEGLTRSELLSIFGIGS